MSIKELEAVIEAILFTMGEAVEVGRIAAAVEHDEDTKTGESVSLNWTVPFSSVRSRKCMNI